MSADTRDVPVMKVLLTPEETAEVLGIGRTKVYELILNRALDSVKIGSCRRVPTQAVVDFVASLRPGPLRSVAPPDLGDSGT